MSSQISSELPAVSRTRSWYFSVGRREVVIWCSNDYLGMGQHPRSSAPWWQPRRAAALARAAPAISPEPTIRSSSWSTSLPTCIARRQRSSLRRAMSLTRPWTPTIAKLLPNCLILSDALNHNSMIEGARQSGCEKEIWRHNDIDHLKQLLPATDPGRPKLIHAGRKDDARGTSSIWMRTGMRWARRTHCCCANTSAACTRSSRARFALIYACTGNDRDREIDDRARARSQVKLKKSRSIAAAMSDAPSRSMMSPLMPAAPARTEPFAAMASKPRFRQRNHISIPHYSRAMDRGIPNHQIASHHVPTSLTMETHMKTVIAALALGTLFTVPAFVQAANAQRLDPARERAIRECMELQRNDPHDGDEGRRTGGFQWYYRVCMANHGQPE